LRGPGRSRTRASLRRRRKGGAVKKIQLQIQFWRGGDLVGARRENPCHAALRGRFRAPCGSSRTASKVFASERRLLPCAPALALLGASARGAGVGAGEAIGGCGVARVALDGRRIRVGGVDGALIGRVAEQLPDRAQLRDAGAESAAPLLMSVWRQEVGGIA
jgi:hypothetical protein